MNMIATYIFLLSVFSTLVSSQRTATQVVYGICVQNKVTNTLRLDFRLDPRNDPQGALWALTPNLVRDTTCTIESPSGGNVMWTTSSTVNLANNLASSNGCSFSTEITANGRTFTWRFLYVERTDRTDVDAGLNRQYTVTCNPNNIVGNEAQASIVPSTPNLPQNILPYVPVVTLALLRQTTAGYVVVPANSQIAVGTNMKLRLSYNYGTFDANKYYGVAGVRTLFANNLAFSNAITFFSDNGCKASTLAPSTAFVKVSNGASDVIGSRVFVQETGAFPIWLWNDSPNIYIKVYYRFCHGSSGFDAVPLCNDPCATLSGTTGRKRRQAEDLSEYNSTFVKVTVYDPDQVSAQQPTISEDDGRDVTHLLIGLSAAVGVILLVLLVVIVCVVRSTKSAAERRGKLVQHSFQSKVR